MTKLKRLLTVLFSICLTVPAWAQQATKPVFSLEGGAVFVSFSGDDFEGTDAGLGFNLAGAVQFNTSFALAIGFQRSFHGTEICDDSGFCIDEDIGAMQLYAEPRWLLTSGSTVPYLAGRLGYVRATADVLGVDFEQSGWTLGGLGGVLIGVASNLKLNIAASAHYVSLGDAEVQGSTAEDTDASGLAIMVHGGVRLSFGSAAGAFRRRR